MGFHALLADETSIPRTCANNRLLNAGTAKNGRFRLCQKRMSFGPMQLFKAAQNGKLYRLCEK